jgi:glutamyl-Q tRNA(Asp) synthetase
VSKLTYTGRFAPSPTGLLHLGSLVAAIASYCEAIKNHGQWLVRIEDLDPPREVAGASKKNIEVLNKLGFVFNQQLIYQSSPMRQAAYQAALDKLTEQSNIYYCTCSRKQLKNITIQTHQCRQSHKIPSLPYSINLKVPNKVIEFTDAIQGHQQYHLQKNCGDFIIKRKDGLFSYQIAVVVDDAYQNITDIVRGIDLIKSTPWQIHLNSLLNYKQASYAHIPILVNTQGQKLSKQTFAKEIDNQDPLTILLSAHSYLNQVPFDKKPPNTKQFWQHIIKHWNLNKIAKVEAIKVLP